MRVEYGLYRYAFAVNFARAFYARAHKGTRVSCRKCFRSARRSTAKKTKKMVGRSEKFGRALTINNQLCFTWPNIGQAELAVSRNMDRSRMSGIGKLHDDVHVPCNN